jgi:transcriptional regulator with XRE-family HTH domain
MAKAVNNGSDVFPMELKIIISENLRRLMKHAEDERLREDKGLAIKAGVSSKTVQRLRLAQSNPNYKPALDSLFRLAHALDIEVWELLRPHKRQPMVTETERRLEKPQAAKGVNTEDSAQRNRHKGNRK